MTLPLTYPISLALMGPFPLPLKRARTTLSSSPVKREKRGPALRSFSKAEWVDEGSLVQARYSNRNSIMKFTLSWLKEHLTFDTVSEL